MKSHRDNSDNMAVNTSFDVVANDKNTLFTVAKLTDPQVTLANLNGFVIFEGIKPRLHVLTLLYNICWFNNVRTCSRHVR